MVVAQDAGPLKWGMENRVFNYDAYATYEWLSPQYYDRHNHVPVPEFDYPAVYAPAADHHSSSIDEWVSQRKM